MPIADSSESPFPAAADEPPHLPPPRAGRWMARLALLGTLALGLLSAAWGTGFLLAAPSSDSAPSTDGGRAPSAATQPATANDAGAGPTLSALWRDEGHRTTAAYAGMALVVCGLIGLWAQPRMEARLAAGMSEYAARVDALEPGARVRDLFVASLVGLFLEVLLIRWHGTEIVAASYFKNVTLLAAFLGLGLGFAAADRPRLSLAVCPLVLAVQVVLIAVMDARGADALLRHPGGEWVWGVAQADWDWSSPQADQTRFWVQAGMFYGFFAALFVSTILIFIPLGQVTGRLMRGMAPIRAYTINILGSLAGVVLFGAASYLWLAPVAWFGLAGVCILYLLRLERRGAALAGTALLVTLSAAGVNFKRDTQDLYSPYQRLEITREAVSGGGRSLDTGVLISANKAYHLRTANLARDFVAAHGERFPRLKEMAAAYELPYALAPSPKRVLVVGAGGGNDVAAALRCGAGQVDAVEIDPAILALGRRHHAERPYDDPRVRVYVDDARAFMRRCPAARYDLIVFGLLDSHTLLSGMSAVRLDNFVYTQESLRDARRLLTADGTLALSFATGRGGELSTRLHEMLIDAFGRAPRAFSLGYDDGTMFIAGAGATRDVQAALAASPSIQETTIDVTAHVAPATDDWPFLYLPAHTSPHWPGRTWSNLPRAYFIMVGMLALISAGWVLAGSGRVTGVSPHFFFLGGAFLLIETKGITELALLYGTTWIVSSVVIAAILLLILLANLFVTLVPRQNRAVHYALLAACLLAGYFVRLDMLLGWGWWAAAATATGLLVLPLFFAGVIFATSLRQAASLPRVFSSNLLGAILGGLCEYSSMALGFRNLYLVGLALYALSFVSLPRRRASEVIQAGAA